MNIIYRIARRIAKQKNLLANPDLYFECNKRMPNERVFLTEKHLSDCKVIPSREDLIRLVPKGGVCAEVGVAQGYFSRIILDTIKPQKMYMIEYSDAYAEDLKSKFAAEIDMGIVEILKGDSVEMLNDLSDESLDFVYLDATHDYVHPKKELEMCLNKVKKDGIIAGHDYTRFSMWESSQYGVIEAVNEFCVTNDYKMIYFTMDLLHSNPSYALKRI